MRTGGAEQDAPPRAQGSTSGVDAGKRGWTRKLGVRLRSLVTPTDRLRLNAAGSTRLARPARGEQREAFAAMLVARTESHVADQ